MRSTLRFIGEGADYKSREQQVSRNG